MAKRHRWGWNGWSSGYTCQDCDCKRTQIYGNRGGRQSTYLTADGGRSSRAPPCIPDTPLLVAVKAYIRSELR